MRFVAALFLALLAIGVHAQAPYPSRPIRLIVPFPPSGSTDVVARAVAQRMRFEQPVLIENRPGAGGTVGTEAGANALPDGHTVLLGTVGTLAGAPSLYPSLGYDPITSFTPISLVAKGYLLIAVHRSLPATSLAGLIELAKSKPRELHLGSPGTGSGPHIGGEMFKQAAGIELLHVPYKGAAALVLDLAAGRVDVALETFASLQGSLQSGKVRALAVASPKRIPQLPTVPTAADAGLPGYEFSVWFGLLAPKGTPSEIVARLNSVVRQALASQELGELLASQGFEVVATSPGEFGAFIAAEEGRWSRAIKAAGTKLE
jgi:tripartite-type tricarboxylate transporter receptor subunit TctC